MRFCPFKNDTSFHRSCLLCLPRSPLGSFNLLQLDSSLMRVSNEIHARTCVTAHCLTIKLHHVPIFHPHLPGHANDSHTSTHTYTRNAIVIRIIYLVFNNYFLSRDKRYLCASSCHRLNLIVFSSLLFSFVLFCFVLLRFLSDSLTAVV